MTYVTRVTHILTETSCSFFITAHEKGFVNIIVRRIKFTVWMKVRVGVEVKDADDFFDITSCRAQLYYTIHMLEHVIRDETAIKVSETWVNTLTLSAIGVRGNHYFERAKDDNIYISLTSTSLKCVEINPTSSTR